MDKECPKCKEVKSLDEFWKYAKSKDGYQSYCRSCTKEYKKDHMPKPKKKMGIIPDGEKTTYSITKKVISGIYAIQIGSKKYIGCSKDIERRIYQHEYELETNTHSNLHLQRAFNKYRDYSWHVIEEANEWIYEKEMMWIDKLNTFGNNGYNNSFGGECGPTIEIDRQELLTDIKNGISLIELSNKYDCTTPTVHNRIRRYDLQDEWEKNRLDRASRGWGPDDKEPHTTLDFLYKTHNDKNLLVPFNFIGNNDLNAFTKLLYIFLANVESQHGKGICDYSKEDISDFLGLSKYQIRAACNELEKHNLVEIKKQGQGMTDILVTKPISTTYDADRSEDVRSLEKQNRALTNALVEMSNLVQNKLTEFNKICDD
jgi:hypothetical protein